MVLFPFQPALPDLLARVLDQEINSASTSLGSYFEKESVLGSLLSLTTIPTSLMEGVQLNAEHVQPFVTLRGFPQPNNDDLLTLEVWFG